MNSQNKILQWIDFLHIYQPPTQSLDVVRRITQESYQLIVRLVRQHPPTKITLNISGCLIELLEQIGAQQLLHDIKMLAEQGSIELVGSAMYHPILPLIPGTEIRRQIELNEAILKKTFGTAYTHKGFYLPEMAYSDTVADIIKDMGFSWIILDEIHALPADKSIDPAIHYKLANGLSVIFRNRAFSRDFPPRKIFTEFDKITSPFIITGHDGELYGHFHKNDDGYYEKVFNSPKIKTITASEYLAQLTTTETITLLPTHWEATEQHITNQNLLHRWNDPQNSIHTSLWQFLSIALSIIETHKDDPHYAGARTHLDRGLASCTWWWASDDKIEGNYRAWNPDMIKNGLQEIISSIRSLNTLSDKERTTTEEIYTKSVLEVTHYHSAHHEYKTS